jgi:hypothetical protein
MKWTYFLLILLLLVSCKKEINHNVVSVSNDVIKQMNTYKPAEGQLETILKNFQSEKNAYQASQSGLKSLVILDDCPVDQAIFQMEAVLNYEYGHVLDSTLAYDNTTTTNFTINTKGLDNNGIVLIDANDMLQKYSDLEELSSTNEAGKGLMFINITLTSIGNGVASFTASKTTGHYVGEAYTGNLSTYEFPSTFPPVYAITSLYYSGKCGMDYINENIFLRRVASTICGAGGELIFTNFSDDHNIGNSIFADSWETDPIYGWGRWGIDKHLIYYNYSSWVEILGYQKMNQYLNGTRYIYQVRSDNLPIGRAIVGWKLGWGTSIIHDTYGNVTHLSDSWITETSADYYCSSTPF